MHSAIVNAPSSLAELPERVRRDADRVSPTRRRSPEAALSSSNGRACTDEPPASPIAALRPAC